MIGLPQHLGIEQRGRVIFAIMMRDMRTRFGRSHVGYMIAIAWPLVHLSVLVSMMLYANRVLPFGTDPAVFVVSGVLPYILCLYPARMMGYSVEANRALFLFPVVNVFDVIVARAVIEFLTAFVVAIIFCGALLSFGVDILPVNYSAWAGGVLATVYLSISMGVLNTVISSIFKMWHVAFVLLMFLMYATAGVFVLPSSFSPGVRAFMWYNPLLHCVEWVRSSYYDGYGGEMLSKEFVFWVATSCLMLGLLGERFLRGKLLGT
ncbi:ABC transporter permease [Ensifer adhaerens]|uniref:ABC transporter permease n=1 Tax=Ensifer adhaerens TaxID=106592 RepID=UPI003F87A1FC